MFSTVVFDFDGTLVDSNSIKRAGFFQVIAGEPGAAALMQQVLDDEMGADRRTIFEAFVWRGGAQGVRSADDLVAAYSVHVDAAIGRAAEMPGAGALLAQLSAAGLALYISSATPLVNLEGVVAQRGWRAFLRGVYGRPATKTDTLRDLLKLEAHGADGLAVVGDGLDDLQSAAAVGCAFFPVGEARGVRPQQRVYALHELQGVLAGPIPRAASR